MAVVRAETKAAIEMREATALADAEARVVLELAPELRLAAMRAAATPNAEVTPEVELWKAATAATAALTGMQVYRARRSPILSSPANPSHPSGRGRC